MASSKFTRGITFYRPNPPSKERHLHIILTDPIRDDKRDKKEKVIIVNITSVVEGEPYDDTYTLDENDGHKNITHLSYVFYRRSQVVTVDRLEKERKSKRISITKDDLKNKVDGIFEGLENSYPILPKKVKNFYNLYLKIEHYYRRRSYRLTRIEEIRLRRRKLREEFYDE